ncbi:hypothetical protein [aff. Roholtiella sp. LEGE 12411]|uniref:hypothetical protein n=1 Tax=aff. Roholtiella sp. LEGE 12411 TaxID=1828822 RepID=UPI001881E5B8|nr:hypothetical protein [aff. Roholtiella sp. LEGE 12411]MBE9037006.1 hypothetical protein [aff. Roholtiella sp. LEGE 12411]
MFTVSATQITSDETVFTFLAVAASIFTVAVAVCRGEKTILELLTVEPGSTWVTAELDERGLMQAAIAPPTSAPASAGTSQPLLGGCLAKA